MKTTEKQRFYSIGEAADLLGISVPTIRMYEREGLIIPLRKSSRHRLFSEADLERIRCLRSTINREKQSIAEIKHYFSAIPCWDLKHCSEESKKTCPVCGTHATPCWLSSGKTWEFRSQYCRECVVYTNAADCTKVKDSSLKKEVALI